MERNRLFVNDVVRPGAKVAVFDTETTGLTNNAKIIQFSGAEYVVENGLKKIKELDFYINPEEPLSDKIKDLTKIEDSTLKQAGTMESKFPLIQRFLEDADVWVGHNISFDIRMLKNEADRLGAWLIQKEAIDTCALAKVFLRKGKDVEDFKLGTITQTLFPEFDINFHNSMQDVYATAMVFQWLCEKCREPEEEKEKVLVTKASIFVNPKKPSQKRIKVNLSQGENGDIFYDIVFKQWGCKATTAANKLFEKIDVSDVERQVLERYKYPDMNSLAKSWMKFIKK